MLFRLVAVEPFADNVIPRYDRQLSVGTQRTVGLTRLAGLHTFRPRLTPRGTTVGLRAVIQRAALEDLEWAECALLKRAPKAIKPPIPSMCSSTLTIYNDIIVEDISRTYRCFKAKAPVRASNQVL